MALELFLIIFFSLTFQGSKDRQTQTRTKEKIFYRLYSFPAYIKHRLFLTGKLKNRDDNFYWSNFLVTNVKQDSM